MEAIKPASGFIGALLSPKIEKLKQWSLEKDLKGRINNDKLSRVIEDYLTKLSHRVSEITSISFPLLKLDIFKAYEPLSLGRLSFREDGQSTTIEVADIINEKQKSFLILDNAGMGKSTFSKYIVTQLLFKSERIPILFELRKINKESDLIENLAKELDFPGKVFDRALFYKLLELGKFYVIIDGFDEVEIEYQQELANQIHELSIKGGENILLMTTRPQDTLPDLVHGDSLKFKAFTISQAISLLKRYDSVAELDVGHRLIDQIESVPEKFIESPLLVSLLYRTFGINNSIAERISTFYDEIYHALYKGHDLINKNGYGREKKSGLDFEDFRKVLRSLCYYMMLNRKTSFENWSEAIQFIDKATTISATSPSSSSNYLDDLLVAVPLMQKEGCEYKFFHKTILEYFSAEYLVFDKSSAKLLGKIFRSKLAASFSKTLEFLSDIDSSLFDRVITHEFALQASEVHDCSEPRTRILTSLVFTKDCYVGVWTEEYAGEQKINDRYIFDSSKTNIKHSRCTWLHEEVEGKKYFFVISHSEVRHNLHEQAWKSITEVISYEKYSRDANSLKDFISITGVNNWNKIDRQFIDENKYNDVFFDLASHTHDYLSDSMGGNFHVICDQKVQSILNKVIKESEIDQEMESFL